MPNQPIIENLDLAHPELVEWWELIRVQYSGKYEFNGGTGVRMHSTEISTVHDLNQPIFIDQPSPVPPIITTPWWSELMKLRFTLHIDIDGPDPLQVVSGTVAQGIHAPTFSNPTHFIGQVVSNTANSGGGRELVVENFTFFWPTGETINRLEIKLTGSFLVKPTAEVTFVTSSNKKHGPYSLQQRSTYFHEIEVEVDREDDALDPEPFDTYTHPDRPAGLKRESLTLEKVFAKSGIKIIRSSGDNTINTSEAGSNNRWSYQELHDAMEKHWSAFANQPQWKMWIFLAELADSDSLGGVMFDGDIDEPGGVDRQGTAIFTKCPHFHSAEGDYPQANPPAAEAAERELFFDLIHETGHAFNLAHSFQKTLGSPWSAPPWVPVTTDPQALSWMNYPDSASPGGGYSAKWFYDLFEFRFDDHENLFLRHAPARFVQMGNEDWFQNHGRVTRASVDPRLQLLVRTRKKIYELGEPITVELRLKNVGSGPVTIHRILDPADGFVQIAITDPQGKRRPFLPIMHTRTLVMPEILEPNDACYLAVNLAVGAFGCPFKEPGAYRIEASYINLDCSTAAAIMQVYVRPPTHYEDRAVVNEMFDARVGRVLYVGGTREMEDVTEKLSWISKKLGKRHPARIQLSLVRTQAFANPFKVVDLESKQIKLVDPEPGFVERTLKPIMDDMEVTADSIGHIFLDRAVNIFTACAVKAKHKSSALTVQSNLIELFKKRKVVPKVIEEAKARLRQLK